MPPRWNPTCRPRRDAGRPPRARPRRHQRPGRSPRRLAAALASTAALGPAALGPAALGPAALAVAMLGLATAAAGCGASSRTVPTAPPAAPAPSPSPGADGARAPDAPPPEPVSAEAFEHARSGMIFPDRVDRFRRVHAREFDDPRLGVGVGYRAGDDHDLTLYVFDLGLPDIPGDPDADPVREAFDMGRRDIDELERRGTYRDVHRGAARVEPLPGTDVAGRVARYTFKVPERDGLEVASWLIVTACKGHFVKLRYTGPRQAARTPALLEAFLSAWVGANRAAFARCDD